MTTPTFDVNTPAANHYNRGMDTKDVSGEKTPVAVGLHTVDSAILLYLQQKIKPVVMQNGKQIQVPIIYGNPERWKSAQQDGAIRDKNGMIQLPIMMIKRNSMKTNSLNSPVNKYLTYAFKTKWNSRNIYDRFAAQNNITPSEAYHVTKVPDYYDFTYEALVWAEYMEQLNKIIENVSFESNEYWGVQNNYRFRVTISDFEQITDLPTNETRLVKSKFTMTVKAYMLPEFSLDRNGNREMNVRMQYSPKKVVFDTEIVTNTTL
jgi:hypothetical protein